MAFKHVLIRDVAYGMLPKAVRSRKHFEVGAFLEERAGDRTDEVVALLAEHYGRAAALGRESGVAPQELESMRGRALHFLEEAGDAAALLYANREAAAHYRHARAIAPQDARARQVCGSARSSATCRCGSAAWTRRSACGPTASTGTAARRTSSAWPTSTGKIGAALSHKGERKAAIEHYQKGINLLKDGPPRIELVRLYEEAAWLYLHTGDNMLAIYASEKALRLAERLDETRAASRAHGIFGRVFGRIGDTEKARENLERAVELARGSDDGETILALSALGRQLEISEADVAGARGGVRGGARARRAGGHAARAGGAARLARPARRLLRRLGAGGAVHRGERRRSPSARGSWASCACRTRCAACCAGARAGSARPPCSSTARTSWRSRWAGRRSPSRRCSAWRSRCATRATSTAPPPRSTRRSRCASAPA